MEQAILTRDLVQMICYKEGTPYSNDLFLRIRNLCNSAKDKDVKAVIVEYLNTNSTKAQNAEEKTSR